MKYNPAPIRWYTGLVYYRAVLLLHKVFSFMKERKSVFDEADAIICHYVRRSFIRVLNVTFIGKTNKQPRYSVLAAQQ